MLFVMLIGIVGLLVDEELLLKEFPLKFALSAVGAGFSESSCKRLLFLLWKLSMLQGSTS